LRDYDEDVYYRNDSMKYCIASKLARLYFEATGLGLRQQQLQLQPKGWGEYLQVDMKKKRRRG
jgi:hypothetical protein